MSTKMLINVVEQEECRIAIVDDGKLDEFYAERTDQKQILGNIYRGRVLNVEPAIQAAFIDFGGVKNGFLHASDVMPAYGLLHHTVAAKGEANGRGGAAGFAGGNGFASGDGYAADDEEDEDAPEGESDDAREGERRPRELDPRSRDILRKARSGRGQRDRDRDPLEIQDLLRRGQEVLVQVTKESIGEKGPSLTTYISLPGRYLVLMPSISRSGISRKIADEDERRQLKRILSDIAPPRGMGYIVRTAGVGRSKDELQSDLDYLLRLWQAIAQRIHEQGSPSTIYQESDLVIRSIRDYLTKDIDEVLVDDEATCERARDFLTAISPRRVNDANVYTGREPLFSHFKIEDQIDQIYKKKVPLTSGGSIVIEQTEAMVSVDVNSGRSTNEKNLEDTAYKTNLEAAEEIARQLRLRDVGGVIACDFIDMKDPRRQREVERTLRNALRRDRARTKVARISQFGIIEMTRQRIRTSKEMTSHGACPYCGGSGVMRTPESIALTVIRMVRVAFSRKEVARVDVRASANVANCLLNRKRKDLADLEATYGKLSSVSADPSFIGEEIAITPLNDRGAVVRI